MKTPFLSTLAAAFLCAAAHGQAMLSFSGGNGTPITLTLAQPINYTITLNTAAGNAPFFLFEGVGNFFPGSFLSVTGSIVFTINAGAPQSINTLNSGFLGGAITPDDIFLFGGFPAFAAGDLVTLSAGTLTTTNNFAGAPPAGGLFNTVIIGGVIPISTFGTPVPEPGSVTLAVVAGLGLLVLARRRAGTDRRQRSPSLRNT